jgi:CRISPR-associated protein Cas2
MQRDHRLVVFAYDIERDRTRMRVAHRLEEVAVRVQKSVFEGRMSQAAARRLARAIERELGPEDSLRVYFLGETAMRTLTLGATPPVERGEFYLL